MASAKDSSLSLSLLPRPNAAFSPSPSIKSHGDLGGKENVAPPAAARCYGNFDPAAVSKPSFNGSSQMLGAKVPLAVAAAEKCRQTLDLKPSSLQICMRQGETERSHGNLESREEHVPYSSDVWYFSDNEAAPASSWSTLPNRSILYRPLPVDVGRCTCVIVKEKAQRLGGISIYSLYTNEGHGRQDRNLAVARHRRRNGRSEFVVAQNISGISSSSDDSFLGTITANLLGTKYHIWDQGSRPHGSKKKQSKLLGVVEFVPTITSLSGSFRSMRGWIPKEQSMQLKNHTTQVQHVNGLPWDFKENSKSHRVFSRVPRYNSTSKRYELDFRERGASVSTRIQSSVKNFQLTLEQNGRQSILQLGRTGKMKFIMEYRYPLTGYQAFCMCLASIDRKLCCSL